jgi:hypothetical protein
MTARLAAVAGLILATSSAAAQGRGERVMPVLDKALDEWRVFLTCTMLDPGAHAMALDGWAGTVERTGAFLRDSGLSDATIDAFAARARPEALMPPDDTPVAEVQAFCGAHPEWRRQLDTFGFTMLPEALEEAIAE